LPPGESKKNIMARTYTSIRRNKIKEAVNIVNQHIIGTPIEAGEFVIPQGDGAKYNNLAFMAQLRRAWAFGKNKTALVAALDNLINVIRK